MPAESLSKIRTEYQKILTACTQLSTTPENPDLIREISPWLMQFEVLGKAGLAATELAALSPRQELCRYWDTYSALIGYENERLRIDKSYNQNPYQPGIKTGSLVMQPFIDSVQMCIRDSEVTATSFNISRDLHCWDMTFSCIPFGTHQSYNFQINVRSSLLRDLKLTKKESWYDTGNFYR